MHGHPDSKQCFELHAWNRLAPISALLLLTELQKQQKPLVDKSTALPPMVQLKEQGLLHFYFF